ncbi:MAG: hypothetical protein FD146_1164 [Anaerolineaceae bacterium]|nr:MAG: hypothetical protein FD146_1164 [Anaerolineaceae bacterium]
MGNLEALADFVLILDDGGMWLPAVFYLGVVLWDTSGETFCKVAAAPPVLERIALTN